MPKFFADECVAAIIVRGLRASGFDVADAKDICQGESDDKALALSASAGRILLTDDRGFGELAVRHNRATNGVVILSLYALRSGVREKYAIDQIVAIAHQCDGRISIIEPGRVRVRPLPKGDLA